MQLLIIDNYDSFTYNLVAYCRELGANCTVYYNDQITTAEIAELNPDKILLSPGPGSPRDSGVTLDVIDQFYKTKPILGVCLGHQCIAHYFGASIINAPYIMHGKNSLVNVVCKNSKLFYNIPSSFSVTRYHSLIIDNATLPDYLSITAVVNSTEIMAIEYRDYQLYGVQFHPEAVLSEFGHQMLNNFLFNI